MKKKKKEGKGRNGERQIFVLRKPQGSGAVILGHWTERVPGVCLPLGEEFC